MSLPEQGVRQRRNRTVREILQEVDTFNKVKDEINEEKSVVSGVYAICCFTLIFILCFGQLHEYWTNDDVTYKFGVDTDYDGRPTLDLDMVIASPCNTLNVIAASQSDANKRGNEDNIVKEPSRFEMDPQEEFLWNTLKEANRQQFRPGARLKSLNDISYVSKSLEQNLQSIAKEKVDDEIADIRKQKELGLLKTNQDDDAPQIIMMIGNGGGMLQLISNNRGPDEGTACRIRGKVHVLKGDGDKFMITSFNTINMGGLFGSIEGFPGANRQNFSHRVERFHFGPHTWGLVTPLAGTDKISPKGSSMYKYFIKVVPTVIHHTFGGKTLTYQYSVTAMQREAHEPGYAFSGISFSYEFVANVIEVYPKQMSFVQLLLRLCSVIGGIFASSFVLHTIFNNVSIFAKSLIGTKEKLLAQQAR